MENISKASKTDIMDEIIETVATGSVPVTKTAVKTSPVKAAQKKTPRKKALVAADSVPKPKVMKLPGKRMPPDLSINLSSPSTAKKHSLEADSPESLNEEMFVIKPPPIKRKKIDAVGNNNNTCDPYCWICHREGPTLDCQVCPRSFHVKCEPLKSGLSATGSITVTPASEWICPECRVVMTAEDFDLRSHAMSLLTLEQFCTLLKYSLSRLKKQAPDDFHKPVSIEDYPNYLEYVTHPLDISLLEKNIKQKMYGSTEAFLADVKFLYHNSVIFNGCSHKLTSVAKNLIKVCKDEMKEIETCPDCYLHAHSIKDNWFVEPCRKPHVLVWAKLKGFPYWPGKVVKVENSNADVRFFGAHDKAWVPTYLCFQLSQDMPQTFKIKKKAAFDSSLEELDMHIQKLRSKLGGFEYAHSRTPLDPDRIYLQPISKVTTGRRHSDVEQSIVPRGRTFTLVTSSWTRKQQAEGGISKKKDHSKDSPHRASPTPPILNKNSMAGNSGEQIKGEPIDYETKDSDSNKNPPPSGVFEISDSAMPQQLKLKSATIVLKKLQDHSFKSAIERISERIMYDDEEEDEEDNGEEELIINEESCSSETSKSTVNSKTDKRLVMDVDETRSEIAFSETSNFESGTSSLAVTPKKSSLFARKLEETIMNCKAKLGIDEEIDVTGIECSDSESELSENNETSEPVVQETAKEPNDPSSSQDEIQESKVKDKTKVVNMDSNSNSKSETKQQTESCETKKTETDKPQKPETDKPQQEILNSATKQVEEPTSSPKKDLPIPSNSQKMNGSEENNDKQNPPNITQYAHKLIDFVQELCKDTESPNNPQANIRSLELEIEKLKWHHKQELMEVKHNTDLVLLEVRASMEVEKKRHIEEMVEKHNYEIAKMKLHYEKENLEAIEITKKSLSCKTCCEDKLLEAEQNRDFKDKLLKDMLAQKLQLNTEKLEAIDITKKKQWCSKCSKEANFYCCWNTSYCDQFCQKAHWQTHMISCTHNEIPGLRISAPNLQQQNFKPIPQAVLQYNIPAGFQLISNNGTLSLSPATIPATTMHPLVKLPQASGTAITGKNTAENPQIINPLPPQNTGK